MTLVSASFVSTAGRPTTPGTLPAIGSRLPVHQADGFPDNASLIGSGLVRSASPKFLTVELVGDHPDVIKAGEGHLAMYAVTGPRVFALVIGTAYLSDEGDMPLAAASLKAASVNPGAAADLILSAHAAELAAGGRLGPGVAKIAGGVYDFAGNLCCGSCTPCRNQARHACIAKNTVEAVANARERARLQRANEATSAVASIRSTREQADPYVAVVDHMSDARLQRRGL